MPGQRQRPFLPVVNKGMNRAGLWLTAGEKRDFFFLNFKNQNIHSSKFKKHFYSLVSKYYIRLSFEFQKYLFNTDLEL